MTRTDAVTEAFTTDTANGVCVAEGYGLRIAIERRHLIISDGIGRQRRTRRYPKVGHDLRRLVVLGHSGTVSLEALRWMDRVGITFTQLDSDGTVLVSSARPGLDDARLRRAQTLAADTPVGDQIVRTLLADKLAGQATVARTQLDHPDLSDHLADLGDQILHSNTLDEARDLEAQGAHAYFAAWPDRVSYQWATRDRPNIPDHWTHFNGRRSPLSHGSATNAADPINATLNYLYALAEIECRNACLTLGLDPGLGFLHADIKGRDSLALDLIEVARPKVDAYLIDLADTHTFRSTDFTETETGRCRILPPLTHQLAQTLPQWANAIAGPAETIAHTLADASTRPIRKATPLSSTTRRQTATQASAHRRRLNAPRPGITPAKTAKPPHACRDCGTPLNHHQRTYCPDCWPTRRQQAATQATIAAAETLTSQSNRQRKSAAIAKGKATARDRQARTLGFDPDDWHNHLATRVTQLTLKQIRNATGLSTGQASRIKRGAQTPPPHHWQPLLDALEAQPQPEASWGVP